MEYEALIRLDLAAELEAHGFAVLEAAAADGAVCLARSHPDLAAVVVNVGTKGDTAGYDLVCAIRRDRPGLLVILACGRELKMPGDFDQHVIVERKPYDPAKIAIILQHGLPADARPRSEAVPA